MWNIDVAMNAGMPIVWQFLYKDKATADSANSLLMQGFIDQKHTDKDVWVNLVDQFGQTANLPVKNIVGFRLIDMNEEQTAQIERGLHQQHTMMRAQRMIQADPKLNGGGIVTPGMGPMMPGMMPPGGRPF